MKVKTAKIKVNHGVMIRQKLDEGRVQEFMEVFDQLPPIRVFEVDGGLLLSDGFHRLAAAERLGFFEIEAEIKKGTRRDAIIEAISINARHGKPLTQEEKVEAVKRLNQLSPDMTNKEIGLLVGYSVNHVSGILRATKVRSSLRRPTFLSNTHLREIAKVDKEIWPDLVTVAEDRGWTGDETAIASQEIRDEKTPAERKRELLAGATDPVIQKEGKPAFLEDTIQRRVTEGLSQDKPLALTGAWNALSKLEQFKAKDVIDSLDSFHLERVVKDTPRDIDYLKELVKFAREKLELSEEVDK